MKAILLMLGMWSLILSQAALAALPKASYVKPSAILKGTGTLAGGQAGELLGLLNVTNFHSPKSKAERITLDFGRSDLQPLKGVVGYYHVELSSNPPRLAVELPLTLGSKLTEKELTARFAQSLNIKKTMITFDRTAQSTSLLFQLKQPMMIRLTRVENPKATGQLVLDLMPLKK